MAAICVFCASSRRLERRLYVQDGPWRLHRAVTRLVVLTLSEAVRSVMAAGLPVSVLISAGGA